MQRTSADRVTFIDAPNKEETVPGGHVVEDDDLLAIEMKNANWPSWVDDGVEVVAANDDGTVITSFTISAISDPASGQATYDEFRLYFA